MKLPHPAKDLQRDLKEFDIWITPALGEITDTDKFKEELARVARIFEEVGQATSNFQDVRHCEPNAIAKTFVRLATGKSEQERAELFKSLPKFQGIFGTYSILFEYLKTELPLFPS
jgi:hypothetical protein